MNEKDKKRATDNVEENEDLNLWVLLEQTFFVMARNRDLELKHYGLTPAQASVLFTLIKNKGQATQNEIADLTIRQHHSVSTLVNRMVNIGLVEKIQSGNSNKSYVAITEKGRKTYLETKRTSLEMIFSVLSKEDKELLASLLKPLLKEAKILLGIDYKPPFLRSKD